MLGAHADHFFRRQMTERVTASRPNAGGQSFSPPDQELAGTATVTARGGYGMPGPQRVVGGDYRPGALAGAGALPGMSGSALPGMSGSALPGMGAVQIDTSTILIAAAAIVGYFYLTSNKPKAA